MTAAVRGCGTRVSGGIYAECPLGPGGRPIEAFIVDPPQMLNTAALGIAPIGVKLLQIDGTWHVADWVGSKHYPNVLDFIEEVRRLGLSRRLPITLDYSRLTAESRILLLHSRALLLNDGPFYMALHAADEPHRCPKDYDSHRMEMKPLDDDNSIPTECCAGLWWEDVECGELVDFQPDATGRTVRRVMPSFEYTARCRPKGLSRTYSHALFATLPITNLAVIRDTADRSHEASLEAARRAGLPVVLEDS